MTENFILSELEISIRADLIGIGIISVILIIIGVLFYKWKKFISLNKEGSNEVNKTIRFRVSHAFSFVVYIVIFAVFLNVLICGVDDLLIKQYAFKNHTYEVREYRVLDKYFDLDIDDYDKFYLELENYGEKIVTEGEYDKVTIGDNVYFIFAIKGEKSCSIGNIYIKGEHFLEEENVWN